MKLCPDRINIICEVNGTSLERLRTLKKCEPHDKEAMKEISNYLRNECYWSYTDIGDMLYRDRTTIKYYLKNE